LSPGTIWGAMFRAKPERIGILIDYFSRKREHRSPVTAKRLFWVLSMPCKTPKFHAQNAGLLCGLRRAGFSPPCFPSRF
jgi:hypothetical protein